MKWRRIVPTCITLTILFLGFQSILKSIDGLYAQAAQLIILAAILDGLDGEVARLFRGVTTFGAKLDTYVDTISFGVAPAVLVYVAVWGEFGAWGTAFAAAIVASGVIRFARYQYRDSRVGHHTFRGLPIPVSGVWMAMIILLTESDVLADGLFMFDKASVAMLMWICTIAFLLLQLSNVRYAKPNKEMIGLGLLAAFVAMAITGRPVMVFYLGTCIGLLYFAFVVPFVVHSELDDEQEEDETVEVRNRW